jgi:hypothetical protein
MIVRSKSAARKMGKIEISHFIFCDFPRNPARAVASAALLCAQTRSAPGKEEARI